jgi:hypothetical protein
MTFNFSGLAYALATVGMMYVGAILAGAPLWPEFAEQQKRHIPSIITGCVIVGGAGFILEFLRP